MLWSDLKKTAKTTLAGAVAAYVAFTKPNARIRFIGNDLKQADSRVFNAITEAIRLNQGWRTSVSVKAHTITFQNGSIIESVAVDPAGEAGGNDDMLEWTELWAATHTAHQKMWNELTLSPTKFGQSFRWIDTYAGYSGESEILERLYNQAVKPEYKIDIGIDGLEVYANERLFCLWNTVPRLSWLIPEYYRQEEANLTASEFRRLHKNEWITSSQTFVPREWWDACKVDTLKSLEPAAPMVIALDAAVSGDCFGLLAISRDDTRGNAIIQPRHVRKWTPPRDGKIDYALVEVELREFAKTHNVIEVAYDPYQLHEFCTRLQRDLNIHFREFPQGTDRIIADKQLQDLIRARRVEHDNNTDLNEHVQNANAKLEGDKLRIVKRSESLKIDLAVCLSMASARILKLW